MAHLYADVGGAFIIHGVGEALGSQDFDDQHSLRLGGEPKVWHDGEGHLVRVNQHLRGDFLQHRNFQISETSAISLSGFGIRVCQHPGMSFLLKTWVGQESATWDFAIFSYIRRVMSLSLTQIPIHRSSQLFT